jgi:hypothetical protein
MRHNSEGLAICEQTCSAHAIVHLRHADCPSPTNRTEVKADPENRVHGDIHGENGGRLGRARP